MKHLIVFCMGAALFTSYLLHKAIEPRLTIAHRFALLDDEQSRQLEQESALLKEMTNTIKEFDHGK